MQTKLFVLKPLLYRLLLDRSKAFFLEVIFASQSSTQDLRRFVYTMLVLSPPRRAHNITDLGKDHLFIATPIASGPLVYYC